MVADTHVDPLHGNPSTPNSSTVANGHASETTRLLPDRAPSTSSDARHDGQDEDDAWKPPRHFYWIELAIMSNVFLSGFDGTITAATYAIISSEFDATNTASWLTTSYLVTYTAFQPLYGRVSDMFGRRICFFISTVAFGLGCLGCGVAGQIVVLNAMRALTGFGGGGLMSMGEPGAPRLRRHIANAQV